VIDNIPEKIIRIQTKSDMGHYIFDEKALESDDEIDVDVEESKSTRE